MKKHIYIYSPAGAVRDKTAFKRGVARLKALGHEVEIDPAALKSHLRFAGDDATRLAAIHRAAASGADVALITRGGYGITRILPAIDYKALAKATDKGMKWVGMSDFTALQSALLVKTGRVTWAGPALGEDFGVEGTPDDIMEACFDDLLGGHGEGAGWRLGSEGVLLAAKSSSGEMELKPAGKEFFVKDAVLWGGNLAVLASLVGTPYLPEMKNGILFLEDVHEHPYRVERMLTQLLHAGVLARQKAVVLGQFTGHKAVPHDKGFRLATVVQWLRKQIKAPVLTNLPFGHVPTKVLLPVGAKVSFSAEGRDALLFWGHLH
ncbi:MAG TPA: LD-carboxypeptidase [Burkholderiaceae bacterium]|nr:LD-carboxypeptidase [Burkholderiaceae bacterium]